MSESDFLNDDEFYEDYKLKLAQRLAKAEGKMIDILSYCNEHIDYMWAAKIAGIILDCDFRDAKDKINEPK